ncbi:FkbM family methyltransferase [bacterium]|nr:FkbM family methyltransferase [bacterium]
MPVNLLDALTGSFVVVNLGSGGDADYDLPSSFLKTITLIEIDAGGNKSATSQRYYRKHLINSVVAGDKSPGEFKIRNYGACSGLREPHQEIIEQYGLQKFYETKSSQHVIPTTLPDILDPLGIDTVDLLKTDLEGLDFEVIKSCDHLLSNVLAIKCELRFQPFYQGEPHFHEVTQYLHERDFELIGLTPEYWKPLTENRKTHRDGRVVFADVFFLKRTEIIRGLPGDKKKISAAKQIIAASMSGHKSQAEWLLDQYRDLLAPEWITELKPIVMSKIERGIPRAIRSVFSWPAVKIKSLARSRNPKNSGSVFDFSHVASAD